MERILDEEKVKVKREMKLQIELIEKLYELITDPNKKSGISLEKRMIVSQGKELLKSL
tara:strand:+ start:1871 stop:2044 length:174 start_codon:yes stop_codon:yes gene_type:complete